MGLCKKGKTQILINIGLCNGLGSLGNRTNIDLIQSVLVNLVNIGSGTGLLLNGTKPLPESGPQETEPMLN